MLWLAMAMSCSPKQDSTPEQEVTTVPNEEFFPRMLEDVPVEDRKYLTDSTVIIANASKQTAHTSAALSKHRPVEPKSEVHTYYLIAGSFSSKDEAQLMVNYFETESIKTEILANKNLKRVAIKVHAKESEARQRMDSLNIRFDGLVEFWLLHAQ